MNKSFGPHNRERFSACGESSTYAMSRSGATIRPFKFLPRLDVASKEACIGSSLPTYGQDVIDACGSKGHPLFWAEWKSVDNYVAYFRDLSIERVWDVACSL